MNRGIAQPSAAPSTAWPSETSFARRIQNTAMTALSTGCGKSGLRIVTGGFVLYAYGMVFTAAFNGAGDARTPTVLNLLVFWAFEVPLAYALARPLGMASRGVYLAIALAFSMLAVASGVVFRRGRGKGRGV